MPEFLPLLRVLSLPEQMGSWAGPWWRPRFFQALVLPGTGGSALPHCPVSSPKLPHCCSQRLMDPLWPQLPQIPPAPRRPHCSFCQNLWMMHSTGAPVSDSVSTLTQGRMGASPKGRRHRAGGGPPGSQVL